MPAERVEVRFASGAVTSCVVGPGVLRDLERLADEAELRGPAAHLVDARVLALHGATALGAAERFGEPIARAVGEATKSLVEVEGICAALAGRKLSRDGFLIAVGGGVLTDLAGFAAAIYLRGIPWISAPTTLLAQVDAGLGGKTGANLGAGKNLVGAFHQPRLVVADTSLLATLPTRELWSGLAEVVKCALLAPAQDARGLSLLERCERGLERAAAADADELAALVEACQRVKAATVAGDEREGGARASLNLGHTVGHAIEAATGYGHFTHGEAVALGLRSTLALSRSRGLLSAADADRALRLVARLQIEPERALSGPQRELALGAMARDKKVRAGRVKFVLLRGLGRWELHDVEPAECAAALEAALS
jgi:3-dehydroquinate synthase